MPGYKSIEPKWVEGQSGNPAGRPKGSRNKSTIPRQVLAMTNVMPSAIFSALKKLYPDLENKLSVEETMTLVQANKAITKGDTQAYKALLEAAYGAPTQTLEHTGLDGGPIQTDSRRTWNVVMHNNGQPVPEPDEE